MSDTISETDSVVTEDVIDTATNVMDSFIGYFHQLFANWTMTTLIIQLVAVFVAILLGYWVSRLLNEKTKLLLPPDDAEGIGALFRRFVVAFIHNVSFSLISGSTLAFITYVLIVSPFVVTREMMLFCRLAYTVFFAYAGLLLLVSFLRGILGSHIVTPTVQRYVTIVFWTLVALQILGFLPEVVEWMQSMTIPLGKNVTVWTCFVAILTILVTLGVANWCASMFDAVIHASKTISDNLKLAISRVVRIVLMILAVIVGLSSVGIDVTVLSVFGGAIGVGIGFGLQKIASNYVSGFIILLDRSIKIGDLVEVSGFRGRVTQINTRYTVVRNADGIENLVPNETFVTSSVRNHSYTDTACVSYMEISVGYSANIERALEIMLEEGMKERPRIVKGRRGWAYLDSFGDSGINLKLGFWVQDPVNGVASLKTAISTAIYRRFQAEGIEVPFPQLDLNLRNVDAKVVPVKVMS